MDNLSPANSSDLFHACFWSVYSTKTCKYFKTFYVINFPFSSVDESSDAQTVYIGGMLTVCDAGYFNTHSFRAVANIISLCLLQFKYSCCIHPYPSVILTLHLRRRYYFYMVNLVVPCSLIAMMVLLSFILPPESGERIGLGITVLMAMAIFQELTSSKLPADSEFISLLGNTFYSLA